MSLSAKAFVYGVAVTLFMVISGFTAMLKMGWYALVPAKQLAALSASQAIVERVGQRNQAKLKEVKSTAAKKASKRIATSTVAGALPGAVVLTATVTAGFMIEDHCDDLKEVFEMDQVLKGGTEPFDYRTCLAQVQAEAAQWADDAKVEAKQNYTNVRSWISESLGRR